MLRTRLRLRSPRQLTLCGAVAEPMAELYYSCVIFYVDGKAQPPSLCDQPGTPTNLAEETPPSCVTVENTNRICTALCGSALIYLLSFMFF
jgi:hypothetical protein